MADSVETWAETSDRLRATGLVQAQASADVLDAAATKWESVLRVHTSMTDLVFTRPEDQHPWPEVARVSYSDGVFEFQLQRPAGLVTADRGGAENASAVLDAFLLQLEWRLGENRVRDWTRAFDLSAA